MLNAESVSPKKANLVLEYAIGFGVGLVGGIVGLVLGNIIMPAMIGCSS
jgi:uncharacterized membrane protein YfcA